MKRAMLLCIGFFACAVTLHAQTKQITPASIEGVWKISETVITGANAATNRNPLPSLVIFTRGHYSLLSVNGTEPRPKFPPAKDPAKLTDAEKIARFEQWNLFSANSGTFEIKGTTLTRRPIVAKNEQVMANPPITEEVQMDGTDLWITAKSAPGQPASEIRARLTRVK